MSSGAIRSYRILKLIPTVLLLAIIGFSVYVYLRYGRRPPPPPPPTTTIITPIRPNTKPESLVSGTKNIEYTHFDNGKKVYHVNASKTVTLKSKQQQLEDPEFIFYDENEQEAIRVTGKHCNMSKNFSVITVYDDALVTSPNRMSVASRQIMYSSDDREFSTPAPATFHWRTLFGKSKGFRYMIDTEELFLPESPEIHFVNREESSRIPIVMTGDHGMIDRKNGFAFFEGNVEITQGKDKIQAHRIEANFKPGGNDLEKITGIKDVHVKFARPGANFEVPEGDLDETQTADTESEEPAKRAPAPVKQVSAPAQSAPTQSAPSMANVFSADSSSGKDLDAEMVELYFYPDGRTINSFHSVGDCTFVLHSYDGDKLKENRIIKGQTFDATFNQAGDMQQFHANQDVSVKLQPAGNSKKEQDAAQQTIFCDDLVTDFVEATGDVKEIHFNDHFRHVQGTQTVSSDKAVYTASLRKTDLIGGPEIEDATFDITSRSMELFEDTSSIHAVGNVKSSFVQGEGNNPRTFPFSSPSKDPVYISSEDMVWDSQKSEARYTEKAKLWQDKSVITAALLVINDKDKTMSAYDKVHTIFYNQGGNSQTQSGPTQTGSTQTKTAQATQSAPTQTAKTATSSGGTQTQPKAVHIFTDDESESDTGPITVDAGVMNYADKDRIIHFEKDVRVVTTTTTINSDRADFYLKQENSDFDRLYAQGKVDIQHSTKHGTGTQATFYNDARKLVLEGNPRLSEVGQADIVGRMLTLFLAEDRILVDGQEDGRAVTALSMEGGFLGTPEPSSSSKSSSSSDKDKKEKKKDKKEEKKHKPH